MSNKRKYRYDPFIILGKSFWRKPCDGCGEKTRCRVDDGPWCKKCNQKELERYKQDERKRHLKFLEEAPEYTCPVHKTEMEKYVIVSDKKNFAGYKCNHEGCDIIITSEMTINQLVAEAKAEKLRQKKLREASNDAALYFAATG